MTDTVQNGSNGDAVIAGSEAPETSRAVMDEVFASFRRAFSERDMTTLVSLWDPEIRVWHSADGRAKDRDEYLAFIAALPRRTVRFVNVRRDYFDDGFVQQQTAEIDMADGGLYRSAVCLVVKMKDGRISRIDEYSA